MDAVETSPEVLGHLVRGLGVTRVKVEDVLGIEDEDLTDKENIIGDCKVKFQTFHSQGQQLILNHNILAHVSKYSCQIYIHIVCNDSLSQACYWCCLKRELVLCGMNMPLQKMRRVLNYFS